LPVGHDLSRVLLRVFGDPGHFRLASALGRSGRQRRPIPSRASTLS
jgi:hypothetical protein